MLSSTQMPATGPQILLTPLAMLSPIVPTAVFGPPLCLSITRSGDASYRLVHLWKESEEGPQAVETLRILSGIWVTETCPETLVPYRCPAWKTYENLLRPLHGRVWVKIDPGDHLSAAEIAARIADAIAARRCPRCDCPMETAAAHARVADVDDITVCAACVEGEARGEPSMKALLSWGFRPADWMDKPWPAESVESESDGLAGATSRNGDVHVEPNGQAQLSWSFSPADWGDS
jgi:hypothetical protein